MTNEKTPVEQLVEDSVGSSRDFQDGEFELAADIVAKIEIIQDDSPSDPSDDDGSGTILTYGDKRSFWDGMEKVFGDNDSAQAAVATLVSGNPVIVGGKAYLGIERYSHSGDSHAVCSTGNFPDRQWDVSPIVGLWTPSEHDPVFEAAAAASDPMAVRAALLSSAKADLETYDQWANGDVWGYCLSVSNDGTEISSDSCWGYYGREAAVDAAKESLADSLQSLPQFSTLADRKPPKP